MKPRVIFLCSFNSCRSQIAEGWARHLHGAWLDAFSAGADSSTVDPRAVEIMAEAGVDMSSHTSKCIDELAHQPFDLMVSVCSSADQNCPVIPGVKKRILRPFPDPGQAVTRLLQSGKSRSDTLTVDAYRLIRDEIRDYIAGWELRDGEVHS